MDDFSYSFIFSGTQFSETERVETIYDVIVSQYNHYFHYNGRSIVHTFVQIFLGIFTDKIVIFDILNSIFFVLLVSLLSIWIIRKNRLLRKDNLLVFATSLIFCWFLIPSPSTTLMWKTAAVNYLWAIVMTLAFIILFEWVNKKKDNISIFRLIPLSIFSLICGWGHEGISVGVAGGIILYCIIKRRYITRTLLIISLSYCLGVLLVVVSPGIIGRASSEMMDTTLLISILKRIMSISLIFTTYKLYATIIFITIFIYLSFRKRLYVKEFIKNNLLLILIYFSIFVFQIAIGFKGQARGAIALEVLAILMLIQMIFDVKESVKQKNIYILISIAICCMLIEYVSVAISCKQNFDCVQKVISDYKVSKDGVVRSPFPEKFINARFIFWEYYFDSNQPQMRRFSQYYDNSKRLSILNRELYDKLYINDVFCIPENQIPNSEGFYTTEDISCIVYPLRDNLFAPHVKIKYEADIQYISELYPFNIILKRVGEYYTTDLRNGYILKTDHGNYMLIEKIDKTATFPIRLSTIEVL
ncbi:MAG: hypothetical protein IJ341_01465 [Bacteroidales bacterium]|nr:hypothetical protein [Bacteroidales bacterium]MBQ7818344.1 hypothetical protein [Bacteroidales bacterium]